MAGKQEFFVNIDMQGNEITHAKVQTVDSAPTASADKVGQLFQVASGEEKGLYYCVDSTTVIKVASASDVATLKTAVGNATDEPLNTGSIYARIAKNAEDIAIISDAVGTSGSTGSGESVNDRVKILENSVGTADDAASADGSLYAKVKKNTSDIGTNSSDLSTLKTDVETVKGTVNNQGSNITTLQNLLGSTTDVASVEGSVYARIAKNVSDISALKNSVGEGADGLSTKVSKNTDDIAAVKKTADAAAVKADVDDALSKKVDKNGTDRLMTEAEGTKLAGIATGAEVNTINAVKVDGTTQTITDKTVNIDMSTFAKKTDISSVYKIAGTLTGINELPTGLGENDNGKVYNIDSSFIHNEKSYPKGTNVVWIWDFATGSGAWDPLAGLTDLSGYLTKDEVNTALESKADASTTYSKTDVDTALGKKVDKLTTKPVAGTYSKVDVNAEGQVTAGSTLAAADIPSLDAGKITTGEFATDRIPELNAAKITSGTLGAERIPDLDATKITSGTLDMARLPFQYATYTTSGGAKTATVTHNFNKVPLFVEVYNASGETVIGVSVTRTASTIVLEGAVELPPLTVTILG